MTNGQFGGRVVGMKILVDADALPNMIKDVLLRAAERERVPAILIANQPVRVPDSEFVSFMLVEDGPDEADDRIAEMTEPGDLVVTQDIPLADRVVSKGAFGLDPRGKFHSASNIKDRLALRNLMADIRDTGANIGGPPPFHKKDVKAFADQLQAFLAKRGRS